MHGADQPGSGRGQGGDEDADAWGKEQIRGPVQIVRGPTGGQKVISLLPGDEAGSFHGRGPGEQDHVPRPTAAGGHESSPLHLAQHGAGHHGLIHRAGDLRMAAGHHNAQIGTGRADLIKDGLDAFGCGDFGGEEQGGQVKLGVAPVTARSLAHTLTA